ncbi:hypothetical protein [Stieleria varia]|uniref:Uncharacterized protein n=1 Tax=Stieleria varia TaxID=2528005 RepID=A0A5C6ASB3_9BACT|nr:hypothetical protein [Stieleria varia]TWU02159.1 hypothetical protein Pla52n_32080 [Stieleria varia]
MSTQIDDALIELTCQLRNQYQELNEIVDQMLQESHFTVDQLSERIKGIKELESRLAPLRDDFRASNSVAPSVIRDPTDETIELVKNLLPKLAQLEKSTVEAANRLFPKIQESVRAVQMQRAYGSRSSSR